MWKSLAIVLALALASSCLADEPQPVLIPPASVCEIDVPVDSMRYEQGSGTLIGKAGNIGEVLTAGHVGVREGNRVIVRWRLLGELKAAGIVIAVLHGGDTSSDLSLIMCECPPDAKPVPIVKYDAANGPWTSWGFRDNKIWHNTADKCHYHDGVMDLNAPYLHGMSGGPTLDKDGRIVSVISSIDVADEDRATTGYSVDGSNLQDLINKFRK